MTSFPVWVDPKFENVHLLLSFLHAQFFETLSTCKLFLRIDACGSWPVLRGIRWKLILASHHSFPLVTALSFEKRQASLGGFPCGSDGKESASCVGDPGSIPGWGRSPGGGHGNPLLYSCLENPMDREAWLATVHGVAWSQIWLSDYHYTQASLTHYFSLFLLIPFLLQLNIFWRTGGSCNLFSL